MGKQHVAHDLRIEVDRRLPGDPVQLLRGHRRDGGVLRILPMAAPRGLGPLPQHCSERDGKQQRTDQDFPSALRYWPQPDSSAR